MGMKLSRSVVGDEMKSVLGRRLIVAGMWLALSSGCGDSEDQVWRSDAPDTCEPAPQLESQRLVVDGQMFQDTAGRQVLLRGVNAGGRSKFPPFFPFPFHESGYPSQEDADSFDVEMARYVDKLEEWGLNVVRLPFSWEAVEPVRGEYDAVYLERLTRYAQHLSDRGIRVILDFHQDVFSRAFCGDGFPLWAQEDPELPLPPIEDCASWFSAYLNGSGPVAEAFDRFWKNEDGLQDALLEMWRQVLRATKDVDGVIGAEVMNEPWEGKLATEDWAANYMKPLVENFYDVVMEERDELIVFFGSAGTDTLSGKTVVHAPDRDAIAFAPHFYDPIVYIMGTTSKKWNPPAVLNNFWQSGLDWNVPVLVGEMGCRTAQRHCDTYTRAVYDTIDTYPMHATSWEYSATKDDWNNEGFGLVEFGGVERPAADEIVRVYPAEIGGTWESFSFDRASRTASLRFVGDDAAWTELVVPPRLFPQGFEIVREEGKSCISWDEARGRVMIQSDGAGTQALTLRAR